MTNYQITQRVEKIHARIRSLEQMRETALMELRHTRDKCPHSAKKRWTNDDGDGQFTVERCEVCGLQKDDGPSR